LRQEKGLPVSRLEVAGYLGPRYRAYLDQIERQMKGWGLGDEFHYRGVLSREEKIGFLEGLDVFSVPCVWEEPKGMFLLEAMAAGVPAVEPRRGALPEIIGRTGGGIVVEPGEESLAEGILSLWKDRALAEELGRSGAQGVRRHYTSAQMARRALEVYESAIGARTGRTAACSKSST
jgi:glycosyltransferase involved in cell wall biosynthesis